VKRFFKALFHDDFKEHVLAFKEDFVASVLLWGRYVRDTWPLLVILVLLLAGAIWVADPAPPKRIVMASGTPGGSYEALALKYQAYLKDYDIDVEIVPSAGPMQNLQWMTGQMPGPKKIDVALTQAGLSQDLPGLEQLIYLGSIDYEPIFFILRRDRLDQVSVNVVESFSKLKIGMGSEGSGTKVQFERLMALDGDLVQRANLINIEDKVATEALLNGELDGLVLVDGIESKNLSRLANTPELVLLEFPRAQAYRRRLPYLSVLQVPEGSINLKQNTPAANLNVLSTTTALVTQEDLHPAVQFLLMKAAVSINGTGSFFADPGLFPRFDDSSIPRSHVADEFYQKGSPYLQRHLPFWLAELIDRLILVLMPFAALAYPIIVALPRYRFRRMNRRIWGGYTKLKELEMEIAHRYDPAKYADYLHLLNQLEEQAIKGRIYGSVGADYFRLRQHIHFVRALLEQHHLRVTDSLPAP
jgi:TRAP-type uncharacterized transport system substrate-binding protein